MSWKCPLCNSENQDSFLRCYYDGYEVSPLFIENKDKLFAMSSNELIEIYKKNDFDKYDDYCFNLIESILDERGEANKISNIRTIHQKESNREDSILEETDITVPDGETKKKTDPSFIKLLDSQVFRVFLFIIGYSIYKVGVKAIPYVSGLIILFWAYWTFKTPEISNPEKRIMNTSVWMGFIGIGNLIIGLLSKLDVWHLFPIEGWFNILIGICFMFVALILYNYKNLLSIIAIALSIIIWSYDTVLLIIDLASVKFTANFNVYAMTFFHIFILNIMMNGFRSLILLRRVAITHSTLKSDIVVAKTISDKTDINSFNTKKSYNDIDSFDAKKLYNLAYQYYESKKYDELLEVSYLILTKFPHLKEAKWAIKHFPLKWNKEINILTLK